MGDRYFCLETTSTLMVEYSNHIKCIPDIQVCLTCLNNYGCAVDYSAVHIFNNTKAEFELQDYVSKAIYLICSSEDMCQSGDEYLRLY
jgi:hypothetical protein